MTCRDEILFAVKKIIAQKGRNEFSVEEVIKKMNEYSTRYDAPTIRTEIVSRMCREAPKHHAVTYNDLSRIGHGLYRLIETGADKHQSYYRLDQSPQNRPVITHPQPKWLDVPVANPSRTHDWFWEGNIQSTVVAFLVRQNYRIVSVADTATHQHGIDIIAEKDGRQLWVSVKGYPKGTEKTKPTVQAGHWFKQALFDMIAYREREKSVMLALALPDFPRYRSLAASISWIKPAANFSYLWVKEQGEVVVE